MNQIHQNMSYFSLLRDKFTLQLQHIKNKNDHVICDRTLNTKHVGIKKNKNKKTQADEEGCMLEKMKALHQRRHQALPGFTRLSTHQEKAYELRDGWTD